MIVARTTELAEQLLTAGELRCPRCEVGQLTAWGYGRRRTIRSHGSATLTIRPRRTRCASCLRTHIVMPAQLQPRHADTTAVIGTALLHKANGLGHRRIATVIDRPVSTVRRWLRRLPAAHLDRIYRDGLQRLLRLDPDTFCALRYNRPLDLTQGPASPCPRSAITATTTASPCRSRRHRAHQLPE